MRLLSCSDRYSTGSVCRRTVTETSSWDAMTPPELNFLIKYSKAGVFCLLSRKKGYNTAPPGGSQ
uniref:Uncharacterized protein n=1 Tax=Human herpesvirus 2 TaxID=10310 RepID=A0A481TTL2_HHV2|nr:hypothetical protein [Human alphaherpesvirus 2]